MTQHQMIHFLIISTFFLIEQNNFTKMNNSHHQDENPDFYDEECIWPPRPLFTYINQNYWVRNSVLCLLVSCEMKLRFLKSCFYLIIDESCKVSNMQ